MTAAALLACGPDPRAANGVPGRKFIPKLGAVLFGCVLVLASAEARAQQCLPLATSPIQGRIDEESQRLLSLGGGFCENHRTGSEECGGVVGKIEFDLELEDASEVDLLCTSDVGVLCIMTTDCQDRLDQRISDQRVRLQGAPDTSLKILIADDDFRGTLCNASAVATVTCAGYFGGNRLFQSGFEGTFEEEDWDTGGCGGCNFFTGTLTAGESAFTHSDGVLLGAGDLRAVLEGSLDSEFDLYLWKKVGSSWKRVARSAAPGSSEEIFRQLARGTYRWEIRAGQRGGTYSLRLGGSDLGELEW